MKAKTKAKTKAPTTAKARKTGPPTRVVVRGSECGVWMGTLVQVTTERTVVLSDARRAWSWTGATECAGLAVRGPGGGKITPSVQTVTLFGVCEVLEATPAAVEAWGQVAPWRV
jgi:hypothetical protein